MEVEKRTSGFEEAIRGRPSRGPSSDAGARTDGRFSWLKSVLNKCRFTRIATERLRHVFAHIAVRFIGHNR